MRRDIVPLKTGEWLIWPPSALDENAKGQPLPEAGPLLLGYSSADELDLDRFPPPNPYSG